jgi:hypothetical protein
MFLIDSILDNSGQGNPVFSKKAKVNNTGYIVFSPPLPSRRREPEIELKRTEIFQRFKEIE